MTKPLSQAFNCAVRGMAARLFPCGFDVAADGTPSTTAELTTHIARTGRMLVWSGASDATIFADPEVNWEFRAWHDWVHWRYQLPMDFAGESAVCKIQQQQLRLRTWKEEY